MALVKSTLVACVTLIISTTAATAESTTTSHVHSDVTKPLPPFHHYEELDFQPRVAVPTKFSLIKQSTDNKSALYKIVLPREYEYQAGSALLAVLQGTPEAVGRSYAELLGDKVEYLYNTWLTRRFPVANDRQVVASLLDWLYDEGLSIFTPTDLQQELKGMGTVEPPKGKNTTDVGTKAKRLVTLSNLPADSQNIEKVILDLVVHCNSTDQWRRLLDIVQADAYYSRDVKSISIMKDVARTAAKILSSSASLSLPRVHGPGMCDFFAVWGNNTEDGRLLSSRNLDFDRDADKPTGKLLTVVRYSGADSVPYFTAGFPGYWGAVAGASASGISVSEANLDNSDVSFRGIAWPLRLRHILGKADDLKEAKRLWDEAPNSAAFNFLIASAIDVNTTFTNNVNGINTNAILQHDSKITQAAMALETTFHHTSTFFGNDPIEDSATFHCNCHLINDTDTHPTCVNGTIQDGVACDWPFSNKTVSIGSSLPNAVWRSNHGLSPAIMSTQEPLWNDTVKRYFMLHDAISYLSKRGDGISALSALNITAYLGIKGSNYTSCDPKYFPPPSEYSGNTMSTLYDSSKYTAYIAWEDGTIRQGNWRPAACNTYIKMDFQQWFYPFD